MKKSGEISSESPIQICSTPTTQNSILDLVMTLCTGCYPNLKVTVELLTELFNYYVDGEGALTDWEYIPVHLVLFNLYFKPNSDPVVA